MGDCNGEKWGWWEERTLGEKIIIGVGLGLLGLGAAAGLLFLFGWVVMRLWNYVMPEVFGLGTISYWQAWALLALSSILFKNFGSGDSGGKRTERKRKKALRSALKEADGETGPEA